MDNNFLITACITHFNDADFILNTLYCLKHLTKNSYKVIIRDNNSSIKQYRKLKKGIGDYKNVFLYRVENFKLKGSLAHGTALNDLVGRIDTPYGVIFDADCTFLIKNWDEILINQLQGKVKIIGTEVSRKEVKDFPFLFAVLFVSSTLKKLNIDFRPNDISKAQDTGWNLRQKYLEAGIEGRLIEMKNTRVYKDGHFKDFLGVGEYYLNGDYEHIFACHFGRGSFSGAAKYTKGTSFIFRLPIIGKPLRKARGKRDKKKWIKICQAIVARQVS